MTTPKGKVKAQQNGKAPPSRRGGGGESKSTSRRANGKAAPTNPSKAASGSASNVEKVTLTCVYCHGSFEVNKGRHSSYCSEGCRSMMSRALKTATVKTLCDGWHISEHMAGMMAEHRRAYPVMKRFLERQGFRFDKTARMWVGQGG